MDEPIGLVSVGGVMGFRAQLDEWAAELDAWVVRRRGLIELLEVVTRDLTDQPHGQQLAASMANSGPCSTSCRR